MKIQFNQLQETIFPNHFGGEKEFACRAFKDEDNKILMAKLIPGASLGVHTHETNSEIMYILSGSGRMLYQEGEERLGAGDCHYCPKGHRHGFINDGDEDLIFFAVVAEQ